MKNSSVYMLAAGVIAASVLPLAGVALAAGPINHAGLNVTGGGVKKATATWNDWTADPLAAPFDAYLVTADDDSSNGPFDADRSRFVDDAASRSVTFDDLTAGTTYFFNLYAVDYTSTGIDIVPATGDPAGTPIGYVAAEGSTLTINNSADLVLSGNNVTVFGTLTGDGGPRDGETVTVESDSFPFDGNWTGTNVTTDGSGDWTKSFTPTINTRYRALFAKPGEVGGWTRNVTVEARKKITVSVDPGNTVPAGTQLKYTGQLGGDSTLLQPPTSDPAVKACLQRLTGSWGSIKCVTVNTDGSFVIKHQPGPDQDGKYRIFSGMGPAYGDSWSKPKKITVN